MKKHADMANARPRVSRRLAGNSMHRRIRSLYKPMRLVAWQMHRPRRILHDSCCHGLLSLWPELRQKTTQPGTSWRSGIRRSNVAICLVPADGMSSDRDAGCRSRLPLKRHQPHPERPAIAWQERLDTLHPSRFGIHLASMRTVNHHVSVLHAQLRSHPLIPCDVDFRIQVGRSTAPVRARPHKMTRQGLWP